MYFEIWAEYFRVPARLLARVLPESFGTILEPIQQRVSAGSSSDAGEHYAAGGATRLRICITYVWAVYVCWVCGILRQCTAVGFFGYTGPRAFHPVHLDGLLPVEFFQGGAANF